LNYYPAMALGTCEASPLEMANAYGIFPANGKRAEPMAVVKIVEQDGSIREDIHPRLRDMGLHDGTVASMDTLTRAVVTSGTGRAASIVPDAHGKTGTTEDSTDAWFVGYTPDLVTAVWAGNRNNKPMAQSVYGGHVCAPIWAKFMLRAIELNPSRKPEAPTQLARKTEPETEAEKAARAERRARRRRERLKAQEDAARMAPDEDGTDRGTVRISVCAESGELAGPGCPRRTQVYSLGEAPTTRCGIAHGDRAVRDSTKEDRGKEKPPAEKPPIDEKKDDGDAKKDTANN
jgi:membrane peptidoglycan carboxypeptidase